MESKSIKTGQSKRPGDTQLVLYLLPLPSITLEWGDLNAKKRTIRIIQNLMGHASIVTTERYSHVLDDEKRKAIDRMSGFLSGMGIRCRALHSRQKIWTATKRQQSNFS